MNETRDLDRDGIHALVRATGLHLSDAELQRVISLNERFADDRVALAGASAGESEPVTIFQATPQEDRA